MTNVLWAVQTKLLQEDSTKFLVEALQKLGLNWCAFPLPPFTKYIPDFRWDGPIIYYGGTNLVQVVYDVPALRENAALFYDERHRPEWYGARLGETWLNHGSSIMTIAAFLAAGYGEYQEFFIKPNGGLKEFCGKVYPVFEFQNLVDRLKKNGMLDELQSIIVHEPLPIQRELRTWVVDGKCSALVGYKVGSRMDPWTEQDDTPLYSEVKAFAESEATKIPELGAYVLDVAVTPNGLKTVEINCIHSAGFYLIDHIFDVVADLSSYVRKLGGNNHG